MNDDSSSLRLQDGSMNCSHKGSLTEDSLSLEENPRGEYQLVVYSVTKGKVQKGEVLF